MTRSTPPRLTRRQSLQIFFTDDLTFMVEKYYERRTIRARPPYGSSCIETLSPTSTLIRCRRILPARYAIVLPPLAKVTRKSVLGSASSTTPSTISGSDIANAREVSYQRGRCRSRCGHAHSDFCRIGWECRRPRRHDICLCCVNADEILYDCLECVFVFSGKR